MSLIRWNPDVFLPITNGFLDDFFLEDFTDMSKDKKFLPAVNIAENKKEFKMDLAVPGFKKEDFKVAVENGYVTISAETEQKTDKKDEKITRREWIYNSFSRSFTLPESVDADNIKANYDKGVLKVTLPKTRVEEKENVKKSIAVQ